MSSSYSVQLGSLLLELALNLDISLREDRSFNLDTALLRSEIWARGQGDIIHTLLVLLDDDGIGFAATCLRKKDQLRVNASLVPSDAPGSRWKRAWRDGRMGYLKQLFHVLRKGVDGTGEPLMGLTVCVPY